MRVSLQLDGRGGILETTDTISRVEATVQNWDTNPVCVFYWTGLR
jgi:hypothetical protein